MTERRCLPLYPGGVPTLAGAEAAEPRDLVPGCTACTLGQELHLSEPREHRCIPDEGEPGGLLLVGEGPGREESSQGRPFVGRSGRYLRELVRKWWEGPVAFANGTRCFPLVELTDKHVDACRGYLSQTLREVAPTRVVTLGNVGAQSVLGRAVQVLSARGGAGWLRGWGAGPVPVFTVPHPAAALRNRFVRQAFEEDLERALTGPIPAQPPWGLEAVLVYEAESARAAAAEIRRCRSVAFDVETAGRMWTAGFRIISCALSDGEAGAWVWTREAMLDDVARAELLSLLADPAIAKVGSNVKYDELAFVAAYGARVSPVTGDARIWRKLQEPEASGALGHMVELVGMGGMKEEQHDAMKGAVALVRRAVKKPGGLEVLGMPPDLEAAIRLGDDPEKHKFDLVAKDVLHRYNARDAVGTARLCSLLARRFEEPSHAGPKRVWDEIAGPASRALVRVEEWGVGASEAAIRSFDRYLEAKEVAARSVLDKHAPGVNWSSPVQIAKLLYGDLGLKVPGLTKKGKPSTDESCLAKLAKQHPIPGALVDYRYYTKLRGSYGLGMLEYLCDDRIHANIKTDGARSGRLSVVDPALQTIPRAETAEGAMARGCFQVPQGYTLIELDFKQIEFKVAAMLSGDPKMLEMIQLADPHTEMAKRISKLAWGIPPEAVTKEHRSKAKTVVFGVLYGKGAWGLAEEWGCSEQEAQDVIDAMFGELRVLKRWCEEQARECARTGEVWTSWGGKPARRRPNYQIADGDDRRRKHAQNVAVNSPIQGTASDYCLASLAATVEWIVGDAVPGVKLVLPVHDALLLEVRDDMVAEAANTVAGIMRGWPTEHGVKLDVECKAGPSWGSLEGYKLETV